VQQCSPASGPPSVPSEIVQRLVEDGAGVNHPRRMSFRRLGGSSQTPTMQRTKIPCGCRIFASHAGKLVEDRGGALISKTARDAGSDQPGQGVLRDEGART